MSQTEGAGPLPSKMERGLLIAGGVIVGIVLICGLCTVVAIVVLALLGPAIGNVFSSTTTYF